MFRWLRVAVGGCFGDGYKFWWTWVVVVGCYCCWCFNGVLEVMVVVFGVSRWLVWWCWCVSLIVEDRDRDEVMEEIIILILFVGIFYIF